ncbi:MAG: Pycsar system effector family protein [Patescibacteria group bacterium]
MTRDQLRFIRDAYLHQREQRTIFDNKASFLMGISGVIFALSMGRIEKVGFLIISLFALLALVLSVWAVSYPLPRPKNVFSLLCWSGFRGMKDHEYEEKIKEVISSDEKIVQEYLKEIYAIAKYSIEPKARLVKLASFILSLSLILGLFFLFIGI